MKLIVNEDERQPDPEPVKVNARLAVIVGLVLWTLVFAVFIIFPATVPAAKPWWPWTCVVGILLGIYALFRVRKG